MGSDAELGEFSVPCLIEHRVRVRGRETDSGYRNPAQFRSFAHLGFILAHVSGR